MPVRCAKPSKSPTELVELLLSREMEIIDRERAERKLSQVGYYRLSGFWYPCRKFKVDNDGKVVVKNKKPVRQDDFLPNTDFNDIFKLYTFDKRLRLLLIDAIERIEVNLKTVLANELGNLDPLAYKKEAFINPIQLKDYYTRSNQVKNSWLEWSQKQCNEVSRCREESILWHKKENIEMPIWVVVEAWSFGTLSKYYEILKKSHQNAIAQRLGLSNSKVLVNWLKEINIVRNRCAHHSRIWNQSSSNTIQLPQDHEEVDTIFFNQFNLTEEHRKKIFVLILIMWFLVKKIGPNSQWINCFLSEIDNLPKLPVDILNAMGMEYIYLDKLRYGL